MAQIPKVALTAPALASALGVVQPANVAAECDGPFPAFRKVAATAELVVLGDVVSIERGGALDPLENGVSSVFARCMCATCFAVRHLRSCRSATFQLNRVPPSLESGWGIGLRSPSVAATSRRR